MRTTHKIITWLALALPFACQDNELSNPALEMEKMPVSIGMSLDNGFSDDTTTLTSRALLTPGEILANGEVLTVEAFSLANSSLLNRASLFCPAMRDENHRRLAAYAESDSTLSFRLWDAASMATDEFVPYLYHLNARASQKAYLYVKGESTEDNGVIDMLQGSAERQQTHFHFDLKHAGAKMTVIMDVQNTDASTEITEIRTSCSRYYPTYTYTIDGLTFKDITDGDFSQATDMRLKWTKNPPESDIILTHQTGADVPENLYNTLIYPQSTKGEYIYVTVTRPKGDVLYSIVCDSIHLVGDENARFLEIEEGKHVVITLKMDLNELLTGYASICDWYDAKAVSPVDGTNVLEGVGLDSAAVEDIDYLAADDVFRIYTPRGLAIFRNIVNAANTLFISGYAGETPPNNLVMANGRLMRDLDMATYSGSANSWTSIGSSVAQAFRGNFDGCGFTISNLKFTELNASRGLFACVGDGLDTDGNKKRIENIVFKDVMLSSTISSVGTLIGQITKNYIISNISVQGTNPNFWASYRGGIVGRAGGLVDFVDCTVDMDIMLPTGDQNSCIPYIGGLVGSIDSSGECTFTDCLLKSDINFRAGRSGVDVGGMVGASSSSIILKNCDCEGIIAAAGQTGGLVGRIENNVEMYNCRMKQAVEFRPRTKLNTTTNVEYYDRESEYFGGLVGYVAGNATFEDCAMLGDKVEGSLTAGAARFVGGIVGTVKQNMVAKNTYCAASYIESREHGGGLAAIVSGSLVLDNCYSTSHVFGRVIPSGTGTYNYSGSAYYMGGLVGYVGNEGTISDSYATGHVSGTYGCGGLVGSIGKYATVTNSHASGNVYRAANGFEGCGDSGGLIGRLCAGFEITDCYAEGNVTGVRVGKSGDVNLGGLIGIAAENNVAVNSSATCTKQITNSYALGSVSSSYGQFVGGLIGQSLSFVKITNCAAGCDLTGGRSNAGSRVESISYGYAIGGLLGGGFCLVDNCKVEHEVYGNGSYIGGFVGLCKASTDVGVAIYSCHFTHNVYGMHSVGGIVGNAGSYMTITGCSSSNNRVGYYPSANTMLGESVTAEGVGGLIGNAGSYCKVSDCYAETEVLGRWHSGGLIGNVGQQAEIRDCHATGNVTMDATDKTRNEYDYTCGGLIGRLGVNGSVVGSYATGKISSNYYNVGGLIGRVDGSSSISDCYATGNVASSSRNVGGLCGKLQATSVLVKNAYATGNVKAAGAGGGLVGYAVNGISLIACRAEGCVDVDGDMAGGLIGHSYGDKKEIIGCYSTGRRVYSGKQDAGGLIGRNSGGTVDIAFCYSLSAVSSTENIGGLFGRADGFVNVYSCYATGGVGGNKNVGALMGGMGNSIVMKNSASTQYEGANYGVGSGLVTNVTYTDWGIMASDIREILVNNSTYSYNINGTTYTAASIWSNDVTPRLPW